MPIMSGNASAKGSSGLSLLCSNNDDGTYILPDFGFDFYYNNVNVRNSCYVSGNSWVGLGSTTDRLRFNSLDTKAAYIYCGPETVGGHKTFRIVWWGYSYYNRTGSYNQGWELVFFEDGTIQFLLLYSPANTGTRQVYSPNNNTWLGFTWSAGRSYVMLPATKYGLTYTLTQGYYVEFDPLYLLDDGANGIKYWDPFNTIWTQCGTAPVTDSMFTTYGNKVFNTSRNGVVSTAPKILMYNLDSTVQSKTLHEVFVPKAHVVKQNIDIIVPTMINRFLLVSNLSGSSMIYTAISIDSGLTWNAYYNNAWVTVDITNIADFALKGMTPSAFNALTKEQINSIGTISTIRLAHMLSQQYTSEVCNIDKEYIYFD